MKLAKWIFKSLYHLIVAFGQIAHGFLWVALTFAILPSFLTFWSVKTEEYTTQIAVNQTATEIAAGKLIYDLIPLWFLLASLIFGFRHIYKGIRKLIPGMKSEKENTNAK